MKEYNQKDALNLLRRRWNGRVGLIVGDTSDSFDGDRVLIKVEPTGNLSIVSLDGSAKLEVAKHTVESLYSDNVDDKFQLVFSPTGLKGDSRSLLIKRTTGVKFGDDQPRKGPSGITEGLLTDIIYALTNRVAKRTGQDDKAIMKGLSKESRDKFDNAITNGLLDLVDRGVIERKDINNILKESKSMKFKKLLNETGEMGRRDLEPGGEDYEWGQALLKGAKELAKLTKGKVKVGELMPWDKYQGPYVKLSVNGKPDKMWSLANEHGEELIVLEYLEYEGSVKEVAKQILST